MADIVVPVVTPFKGWELDTEALRLHAENLFRKGVDYVFLSGTTGLGPALSPEEKLRALEALRDYADRVIFQVGELNLDRTAELARKAEDFGVKALASYPVYYFQRIPEKHLVRYFKDICSYTSLPVFLYNYPLATGKDVDARLVEEIGCLSGVKDTNESLPHTLKYKLRIPRLTVYNGSDSLVFASLTFLDGTVASTGNYVPELLVAIKKLVSTKDFEKAMKLQSLLDGLVEVARKYGSFSANYELVRIFQGYSVGKPRPPIYPLEDSEVKALEAEVRTVKEKVAELTS